MFHKFKIAVLRGGYDREYEMSMKSGGEILKNLSLDKYTVYDVSISKNGAWYLNGEQISPNSILERVDFVFNSLGCGGDNKNIVRMLESFAIPYSGSNPMASSLSASKIISKRICETEGIKTPYYSTIRRDEYDEKKSHDVFREIIMPCVVKPSDSGYSVGVHIVSSATELKEAILNVFEISDAVLIEELIKGREITCGVIENFRGNKNYSLLPLEISTPDEFNFLNHDFKKEGSFDHTTQILTREEREKIQEISWKIHNILNIRHYSRSDFIFTPKGDIYFLEVNSSPALHKDSLFIKSLEAVGSDLPEFLNHLIEFDRDFI
ncbi:hypothetical protein A2442_04075 [Candidatus Campbellbacteria bacterium RIFOXYC2_FULL_35_25]|uniref:ATP-grasp domain-containing protein n=1 Tax=Candidatus Campbellbacteria bacterium RIFOXYC2_FULL_35_25 TaxID=1797582 RepID=A0A1F5EJV4_9BACT|nr:MAG: hypothetical protein A2442_04075 [Candidatus Campbellbacteria bacterium RIFOXYC2_FULL_35_25]